MLRVMKLACLISGFSLMMVTLAMWRAQFSHPQEVDAMFLSGSCSKPFSYAITVPKFKKPISCLDSQLDLIGTDAEWLYFVDYSAGIFDTASVFRVSKISRRYQKLFNIDANQLVRISAMPDMQWIIYQTSNHVFRVQSDGQALLDLTATLPGHIGLLDLSPDYRWVYVVADFQDSIGVSHSTQQLYRIRLVDGQIEELTPQFADVLLGESNYIVRVLSNGFLLLYWDSGIYLLQADGQIITQLRGHSHDNPQLQAIVPNRAMIIIQVGNSELSYTGLRAFNTTTGELLWESPSGYSLWAVAVDGEWVFVSDRSLQSFPIGSDGSGVTSNTAPFWEGLALDVYGYRVLCDDTYYCGEVLGPISPEIRFPDNFQLPPNLIYDSYLHRWHISGGWIYMMLYDQNDQNYNYYRFRLDGTNFEQVTDFAQGSGVLKGVTRWRLSDWDTPLLVCVAFGLCLIGVFHPRRKV